MARWTSISSAVERFTFVGISLVSVPLILGHLGPEMYGLWATLTSAVVFLTYADLGIGIGTMNVVARATGNDDFSQVSQSASNAVIMQTAIAAMLITLAIVSVPLVDWHGVFGFESNVSPAVVAYAVLTFVVVVSVGMPLGISNRLAFGLQRGYLVGIGMTIGGALSLLLLLGAIHLELGVAAILAVTLSPPLTGAAIVLAVLRRTEKRISFDRRLFSIAEINGLLSIGMQFFLIQLSFAICYGADNLIIARVLGVSEVAEYSVHQKLFGLIQAFSSLVAMPLWPAYMEAVARGDIGWAKRMMWRSARLLFLAGFVLAMLLYFLGPLLLVYWIGEKISFSSTLGLGLAVWAIIEATARAFAIFLNGIGQLKPQLKIVVVFIPVCLLLKTIGAYWFGIDAIPVAMAIAWTTTHIPVYYTVIRRWYQERSAADETEAGEAS